MGLVVVSVQVFLDFNQLLGKSAGFWKLYDVIHCYKDGFFLVIIGHFSSSFVHLYGPKTGLQLDPVGDTGVQQR